MTLFLQLILNVGVQNRRFWQFTFHGVHFNHDSENSFSVSSVDTKNGRSRFHENKLTPLLLSTETDITLKVDFHCQVILTSVNVKVEQGPVRPFIQF